MFILVSMFRELDKVNKGASVLSVCALLGIEIKEWTAH